ncbi:MAG: aspartate kinase [Calditrichia bacterium]
MALIVQKYGGSSVATPGQIRKVAGRIVDEQRKGNQIVVVVSALGDTTDELVKLAHQVCSEPPEREMDMLLSTGERVSIALLAMAVIELGGDAISFTGSQIGIITDNRHTEARILEIRASRLMEELQKGRAVIVAGFQGVSINKEITTLGRGGSDATALALAAALQADRCEMMKDVDGIYLAEPRLIPEVKMNQKISYDEMLEMSHFGAGVLQTESVEIAKSHNIKVGIGSSSTGKIGTIITDRSLDKSRISGIVQRDKLCYLKVSEIQDQHRSEFMNNVSRQNIKTYLFEAGSGVLEMVFDSSRKQKVNLCLESIDILPAPKTSFEENLGIVAITGAGLSFASSAARRIFKVLSDLAFPVQKMEVSQLRISLLLPQNFVDDMVIELYQRLFEGQEGL